MAPKAVPASGTEVVKKPKKWLPPQDSIDEIWDRFSVKVSSKAISILPTSPQRPAFPQIQGQLVSDDYETAAKSCRKHVDKIIEECRRVNQRYRDVNFDIDWDLKLKKGNCLNGLEGPKRYDLLCCCDDERPNAVKRVHEIFEQPTFSPETANPADIKQGSLGDCWLISSLDNLANMPAERGISRICVKHDTKVGVYGFLFSRDGQWVSSIVDDKLYLTKPNWDEVSTERYMLKQIEPNEGEDSEKVYRSVYQSGSGALFFARCRDKNETWLPLLEKAYAKAHGDYSALQNGWTGEGLEDLTGGVTTELFASDILDIDEFWEKELMKVNVEFLFGCSTGLIDHGYGERDGIKESHSYSIMEAKTTKSGERLLKLRNPWGVPKEGLWTGAWSDGSKEWTIDAMQELGYQFGSDSVFWMSYKDVLRKYQFFDRTRLFHDKPDWYVSQQWTSIDVPWRTDYQEKSRMTLTKDSPVVIVLSQLDDRYFKGLEGQYEYTLQFRLHESGSQDAEDYIVRSHGNYLMTRSVSVELKCLQQGTYSVFVKVFATRDLEKSSAEDVVKKLCHEKEDNEKLLQVGHAYDVAHSKGSKDLNREIKTQRARERKTKKRYGKAAKKKMLKELAVTQNTTRFVEDEMTRNKTPLAVPLETTTRAEPTPQLLEPDNTIQPALPLPLPGSEHTRQEEVQTTKPLAITIKNLNLHAQQKDAANLHSISRVTDSSDDSSSEEVFTRRRRHGDEDRGWYNDEQYETEDENDAKPWNAVCVIGFKVYSKDPNLTIDIVPSSRGKEAPMDPDDIQIDAVEDVKWPDPQEKGKESQEVSSLPYYKEKENDNKETPSMSDSPRKGKESEGAPTSPKKKTTRTGNVVFTGLEDIHSSRY